jgi:type IV pilus assembly protein PilQ
VKFQPISVLALVALAVPSLAQVPSLDARVNVNVVEQDLAKVVQYLRDRSGANIVILEGGERMVRDLQITDVHWRDALDYATQLAGCVVEEDKSGVLKVSSPPAVDFEMDEEVELTTIINAIAKIADANILISPEVTGTVRGRIQNVPWRAALEEICKLRGYAVVEDQRGILRVVDPLSLEQQQVTRIYNLRYLRPVGPRVPIIKTEFHDGGPKPPEGEVTEHFSVLHSLRKALSPSGELDYMKEQNALVVRDTTQVHDAIHDMLRQVDIEPAQVFIDVKFVSTTNTDLLSLGVDYGDAGPQISFGGGQIPVEFPFELGGGGWEDDIIANSDNRGPYSDSSLNDSNTLIPDTIFGALSFTQVAATINMLQRDTNAEVIQAPKIVTMDGNEATIFVGETVRYAEAKSEQGQAGGLQLTVAEASGSPVEVGFQLLVRPNVIPGTNKVLMEVIPKETSLSGSSGSSALAPAGFDIFTVGAAGNEGSIALPRTRSSTMFTQMLVESGQTAVIGGLTTDIDSSYRSRVPYISRIPILGELFKYKSETRDRRSLIIFIQPRLVHSAADTEFMLQQELHKRRARLIDEVEALVDPEFSGK